MVTLINGYSSWTWRGCGVETTSAEDGDRSGTRRASLEEVAYGMLRLNLSGWDLMTMNSSLLARNSTVAGGRGARKEEFDILV